MYYYSLNICHISGWPWKLNVRSAKDYQIQNYKLSQSESKFGFTFLVWRCLVKLLSVERGVWFWQSYPPLIISSKWLPQCFHLESLANKRTWPLTAELGEIGVSNQLLIISVGMFPSLQRRPYGFEPRAKLYDVARGLAKLTFPPNRASAHSISWSLQFFIFKFVVMI